MARDQLEEEALITLSRMQRESFDAKPNGTGPDIPKEKKEDRRGR